MARCKPPPLSRDLDAAEIAPRKREISGAKIRALMLARAVTYERRGRRNTARFWQAVAAKIDVIAAEIGDR